MAAASLPADLQAELTALILSLEGLERARYLAIASMCYFLYDILLTFDLEVRTSLNIHGFHILTLFGCINTHR